MPELSLGDRVRVFWPDENEWFHGVLQQREEGRCFIRYDDGDSEWEKTQDVELTEEYKSDSFDSLSFEQTGQISVSDSASPEDDYSSEGFESMLDSPGKPTPSLVYALGDQVQVFWKTDQAWFRGVIHEIKSETDEYYIQYQDGDEAWENRQDLRPVPAPPRTMTSSGEKILIPRAYVRQTFDPICQPRPYVAQYTKHLGSIIVPREYQVQAVHSFMECEKFDVPLDNIAEAQTQTHA